MTTSWRHAIATALVASALVAGAGCGGDGNDDQLPASSPTAPAQATPADAGYPVQVQNSDGSTLTVAEPPRRIVSLSPGATEILYAIGANDALVAVDNQADYPAAAASFATKVDAFQPSVETIAGLEPDLAIVASDSGGIVAALGRVNVPVLYIDIDTDVLTIADVIEQIRLLGHVTGRTARAEDLADNLDARVAAVKDKIGGAGAGMLTVYHELDDTYYSVAEQTFIGSVYATLGAENIAGDGGGTAYPQLTQEAIIAANPAVIVLADEEFGVTIDSVKARPGWDAIDAVKNGRIYPIDPDIISRPGPRIVDALEQLAKQFYPEAFQ